MFGEAGTTDRSATRQAMHRLLVTQDMEQARRYVTEVYVTEVYVPHELQTWDGRVLDFRLRCFPSERLTIGHLGYGADAELLVPPMRAATT